MPRAFLSQFLLPLVQGGTLRVGRPLGLQDIAPLMDAHAHAHAHARAQALAASPRSPSAEPRAAAALASARRRALVPLWACPLAPQMDEASWRLGAAVHDLLALSHPRIGSGAGAQGRVLRVAAAAEALAQLGAPVSLAETLARHSLLARLPDISRVDHTVRYWLGRRTFVGRRPPARILALPNLRNVNVETARFTWLRDVGVLVAARPAFAALTEASPLGEALDPLRLDPPWSWGRALSILRFPALCRVVAGRMIDLGLPRAGDALTEALYRFAALPTAPSAVTATPQALAFAISFLAHLSWLDHLFDRGPAAARSTGAGGDAGPGNASRPMLEPGRELMVLLAAASRLAPALLWPPDVPQDSDVGHSYRRHMSGLFQRHDVDLSPRRPLAEDLVRQAAAAAATARPRLPGDAV